MNAVLGFNPEVGHDYEAGETGRTFEKVDLTDFSKELAEKALLRRVGNAEWLYGGITRLFLYEYDGFLYLEAFFNRSASSLFGESK